MPAHNARGRGLAASRPRPWSRPNPFQAHHGDKACPVYSLTRFRGQRNTALKPMMVKTRPSYTPAFGRQMVELVRAGRPPGRADAGGAEKGPTVQAVRPGARSVRRGSVVAPPTIRPCPAPPVATPR